MPFAQPHRVPVCRLLAALVVTALVFPPVARLDARSGDPFAIFGPGVVVTPEDRAALDRGGTLTRVLPAEDSEVAVFVAIAVHADGDRLVSWVRKIAQLRKSPYVIAIRRFSDPPTLDDVADLSLDDGDLSALRHCDPGSCDLKLSAAEMRTLRAAAAGESSTWKAHVQQEFRQIVLERVKGYLADGHPGLAALEDKSHPVPLGSAFADVIGRSPFLTSHLPEFASYLNRYPRAPMGGVESFLYWSKDHLGGKPQISVTQIAIVRGGAEDSFDALVAAKQVFATHYTDASLSITAILPSPSGDRYYLAYLNRTNLDMLNGFFGGLVRHFVQRRLKSEAPAVLLSLRDRLESGEPKAGVEERNH